MLTYIIIKLRKTEGKRTRILKAAREKWHFMYRGKTIQMTVSFSIELGGQEEVAQHFSSTEKGK